MTAPVAAPPLVDLRGVGKSFGVTDRRTAVLHDIDLTIVAGAKVSLVGPSGSGKSTLLSLIAGLLFPDVGSVTIGGVALGDLADHARARLRVSQIGIALQSGNLIPFLTARENIELAFTFASRPDRRRARERAKELLERFDLADRADHVPRQLSGGETQRVALAVAMANRPSLLLADEVVGQLDGPTAGRVIEEVLAADFAVLLVTHDTALADLADEHYELVEGRIRPRPVPRR